MRVLIVRAGALGDLLLLRRAIWALRLGGHEPVLLAPARVADCLLGPGPSEVREVLDIDGPWFAAALAGEDGAGDILRSFAAAAAFTRSGDLLELIGRFVPRVVAWDPAPSGVHASAWAAMAVEQLGCGTPAGVPPDLEATRDEAAAAAAIIEGLDGPLLVVHPGSGSKRKNWPAASFGVLARRLTSGRWVLLQGPVGNDSGLSHLAAAAGAPTLSLFGPTDPTLWAPVGRRVQTLSSPTGSIGDLSLESVVGAAHALWPGGRTRPTSERPIG